MTVIRRRLRPLGRLLARFAVLTAVAGCSQASPPLETTSPVVSSMYRHFALARDLRSFAVIGDLDRIHVTADALSTAEETWGMPPGSDRYLEDLRAAARVAATARNLDSAAVAVAEVARTCGACHLTNEVTLGARFQVAQPVVDDPATRHVNYLSWASRLLWDGLLGPSDRLWGVGAGALADPAVFPAPEAAFVPTAEVERSRERLEELGAEAATMDDPVARARVLGRIWAVCAGCHTQAAVGR